MNGMRYLKTMLLAHTRIPDMEARIANAKHYFAPMDSQTSLELYETISSHMEEYDLQWRDGVICGASSAAFMLGVMKLLAEPGTDTWSNQVVGECAVLLGESTNSTAESADVVGSMEAIKDQVLVKFAGSAAQFKALDVFEAHSFLLRSVPLFAELIERHGHRCVLESEMRKKDWGEDPSVVVSLLQTMVGSPATSKPTSGDTQSDASKLIDSKSHLNFVTRPLLRFLVDFTRSKVHLRELGKSYQIKLNSLYKRAYRCLGKQLKSEGILADEDLIYFLTHEELGELIRGENDNLKLRAVKRRRLFPLQEGLKFADLQKGVPEVYVPAGRGEQTSFQGTPVSAGLCKGRARVVKTLEEAHNLLEGEILVCPYTDVGWTPFFSIAGGLCTEIGGMLSHGAVVAREYGLPCIVGIEHVCDMVETGDLIVLDGKAGTIVVVNED